MKTLICLKSSDGSVLFTRTHHTSKDLPPQIIGTLNSIFTFGDNFGFRIHSIDSTEFKLIWKMYHANITLILVESLEPIDDSVYFRKLDLVFDSMVIMYGLKDLINISNVEKFKKEIRVSFPIIDSILFNYSNIDLFGGYLTDCVDLMLVNNLTSFQSVLDTSCQSINSLYSCLILNGRIITASSAWWDLKPVESYLINLLSLTLNYSTSRDIPIYLPYKNPNQAWRLLTYNLCSNIYLCFICSEKPTVDSVELIVKNLWHSIYKELIGLKQYLPRNLPTNLSMDKNMIAFLLINKKTKCCTSSLCPNEKLINPILSKDDSIFRYNLLKYCYLNISSNFFHLNSSINEEKKDLYEDSDDMTSCSETYTLILDHKCYALNEEFFEFYALYNKNIPTYALRGATKTCFEILINSSNYNREN